MQKDNDTQGLVIGIKRALLTPLYNGDLMTSCLYECSIDLDNDQPAHDTFCRWAVWHYRFYQLDDAYDYGRTRLAHGMADL